MKMDLGTASMLRVAFLQKDKEMIIYLNRQHFKKVKESQKSG